MIISAHMRLADSFPGFLVILSFGFIVEVDCYRVCFCYFLDVNGIVQQYWACTGLTLAASAQYRPSTANLNCFLMAHFNSFEAKIHMFVC